MRKKMIKFKKNGEKVAAASLNLTFSLFFSSSNTRTGPSFCTPTQYGFVNYALELLVLKNFGLEIWEKIK
jgi:hypothetical protein